MKGIQICTYLSDLLLHDRVRLEILIDMNMKWYYLMLEHMFLHLSILCIDMDSFHFHNLNQSTGMYNHISTLHFLSYICHHSCREKIHKDLWMKDVWQYCNTAFQSITMWKEFKYAPTFLIYFFMTEYALKSFGTWTFIGFKIQCWMTCSSI